MLTGVVNLNNNKCLKDINSDDDSSDSDNGLNNMKINDEVLFNPFNANNQEIVIANVQQLLSNYGIVAKPFNIELYIISSIYNSFGIFICCMLQDR